MARTISPDGTELFAPPGQFRVVFCDTFDHSDCVIGDYASKDEAVEIARQHGEGKQMTRVYVYNHEGKELSGGFGTY